jgi:hypothetical protein
MEETCTASQFIGVEAFRALREEHIATIKKILIASLRQTIQEHLNGGVLPTIAIQDPLEYFSDLRELTNELTTLGYKVERVCSAGGFAFSVSV